MREPDPDRGTTLRVEFLADQPPPAALKSAWEALNACRSDHEAPFFQSWDWCAHVAACRLREAGSAYRPLIALVHDGAQLIGVWPLSLQSARGARIARMLDDPFGQFAGAAFNSTPALIAGTRAVIDALRRERRCDGMQIENVPSGSGLETALREAGARARASGDAVIVDLAPHAAFADYRETLNKKTLKNLRNLHNRLQRTLPTTHYVVCDRGERLDRLLRWTFEERVDWLHNNARTSPAFRDAQFKTLLLSLPDTSIALMGFALEGTDTFVAAQWGFRYLNKYYAYLSARNPAYDAFSPGRIHLGMVIDACKAAALDGLELMAPPAAYKLDWSRQTRGMATHSMAFSARGYWALELLSNRIEPMARRASRALPHWVRQPLIKLINRN